MKFRIALAVIGMALMMVGCGKKEKEPTYSEEDGKVTIVGEEGTTTMVGGKVSLPDDLGLTLYPGATAGKGGTLQVESEGEDGAGSVVSVSAHSVDAIDKVAQYYKNEIKDKQPRIFEMAMPTGKMVTITVEEEGAVKTVVLSENTRQGGTDIQISRIRE